MSHLSSPTNRFASREGELTGKEAPKTFNYGNESRVTPTMRRAIGVYAQSPMKLHSSVRRNDVRFSTKPHRTLLPLTLGACRLPFPNFRPLPLLAFRPFPTLFKNTSVGIKESEPK